MITASDRFKANASAPVKTIRANFAGIDSGEDLMSIKMTSEGTWLGTACKKIEAKFIGIHAELQDIISDFSLGILDNTSSEWDDIILGSFKVYEVKCDYDKNSTSIVAYDAMYRAMNTPYDAERFTFPMTVQSLAEAVSSVLGVDLADVSALPNVGYMIAEDLYAFINGCTLRDVIDEIAKTTATTAKMNGGGALEFVPFVAPTEIMTSANMKTLRLKDHFGKINTVVISRQPQNDDIAYPNDGSVATPIEQKIINVEILDDDRESLIVPIYNALKDTAFDGAEISTEGHGWYEVGDTVQVVGFNSGDTHAVPFITSYSLEVNGGLKEIVRSIVPDMTKTNYMTAGGITKSIYNTEIKTDKQGQRIDSVVERQDIFEGEVVDNFSKVSQTVTNVITAVQGSGGSNLIENSVGFATDSDGLPQIWQSYLTDQKNLIDKSAKRMGFLDATTGEFIELNTSWANSFMLNAIKVDAGQALTISGVYSKESRLRFYDNFGTYLTNIDVPALTSSNKFTHTFVRAGYIIPLCYQGATQAELDSLQFEYGTAKTAYAGFVKGSVSSATSSESLQAGGSSGNIIILNRAFIRQAVRVKRWDNASPDETNQQYNFHFRVHKAAGATGYVRIFNENEDYKIELTTADTPFYALFEIPNLKPQSDRYEVEVYGASASSFAITDMMFSIGEYRTQWQQASGEIMNTQVNMNKDGITIKSELYEGDETIITPLEFAGYSSVSGTRTKVFTLNRDRTEVQRLKVIDGVNLNPIKIVQMANGIAFVPSTEND